MPAINPDRLLQDLHTLRSFGACGNGVVRPSLSPVDREARHWLCERMREAGLNAGIDGLGNVIGRSPLPGPALLCGSHSDTQPRGGWLDGALGVIYALEVARACREDPAARDRVAVDPVAWVDEEGTFLTCLGSRGYCGLLQPDEIDRARNAEGLPLREALAVAGLDGTPARPEAGRYRGYLEAHIEQGPHLEAAGLQIGVVTGIVGSHTWTLRFSGQQNHAGTTPMPLRRDAGLTLIRLAARIDQRCAELAGPATVWTVGDVRFDPGTCSIIPGRADMQMQYRDPDPERLRRLHAALTELVDEANRAGPVRIDAEPGAHLPPVMMDPTLTDELAAAAERHAPGRWQRMPSAAIHDATYLNEAMPAAMLFIPSIDGISHDFAEDSDETDIVRGCQTLASAATAILAPDLNA